MFVPYFYIPSNHSICSRTIGSAVMATEKTGGVNSLEKRFEQLEVATDRPVTSDRWYDRMEISGLIAVDTLTAQLTVGF